ncbi:MAG TPA: winged helix-turn-helix domain-containing protein, partial [Saccharofermentans sp.]|nr:winged helix-turn-helix domain-containing protein [Saccharofermentans sp.]
LKSVRKKTDKNFDVYSNNEYEFDFLRMIFKVNGNQVELSKTEQKLLYILVENENVVIKRNDLIDKIWTDGSEYVDENALSVAVKRLRLKLSAQEYIKTIYGIGYKWSFDSEDEAK